MWLQMRSLRARAWQRLGLLKDLLMMRDE